jgi:capsid protein
VSSSSGFDESYSASRAELLEFWRAVLARANGSFAITARRAAKPSSRKLSRAD